MSSILRIGKQELDQLVSALAARYRLFAPVDLDGVKVWREVRSAGQIAAGLPFTAEPAKAAFFPQTETLVQFAPVEPTDPARPIAVLGVRPCDARGIRLLDTVFRAGKFTDPCWSRRFGDGLVIGLGCNERRETCFCDRLGSGPFSSEGSDIMLTDIGDAYVAESCSDKGEKFLRAAYRERLQRPSDEDLAKSGTRRQAAKAGNRLPTVTCQPSTWDSAVWDDVAMRCLSCSACAFVCPTCHCFDVQDEGTRRVRIWDTCSAPLFTKEASGHNPRPTGRERCRQRVMHKFSYFVDTYGSVGCTGCGRCVEVCPANVDIREVVERLVGT